MGAKEHGVTSWISQKYSLAHPIIKLWTKWSCWGGNTKLKLVAKAWAYKKKKILPIFLIAC
jgi:hypothetical protein